MFQITDHSGDSYSIMAANASFVVRMQLSAIGMLKRIREGG